MRAPVGGVLRHVADLTRALAAMGHEVGLVVDSLAADARSEAQLLALTPHAGLGIHRLAMPRLFGPGDLVAPLAVRRLARDLSIDILHGHGAKGGFYARLARIGAPRAAALYTPHGGVLHFSARSFGGRLFHRIERHLMGQTAAIIFESAFSQRRYSELIAPPTCPTAIIHNGIAPAEFTPVPPAEDAADFVFVGELRALKGIFVLAAAMPDLRRPDGRPASLVMAGDGPERAALTHKLQALDLGGRVTLLGAQPARAMFARGRCLVIPSLAESLPYIALEAAAARLPIIATRVGGLPEIFSSTDATLLPAGDAMALARAMQAFLDDAAPFQAEAQSRLAPIEQAFTLERMAEQILALYRKSLAAP